MQVKYGGLTVTYLVVGVVHTQIAFGDHNCKMAVGNGDYNVRGRDYLEQVSGSCTSSVS